MWLRAGAVWVVALALLANVGCGRTRGSGEGSAAESAVAPPPASEAGAVGEDGSVAYDSARVGALEVKSANPQPVDWFDVLQDGKRAFSGNPQLLNTTLELPPGTYVVDVNRTQREVTIEAGRKAVLWTGELVVEGEPYHAFWYPMQGSERRLSSNPPLLGTARALFPGSYTVYVYVSVTTGDQLLGEAQVRSAQRTVVEKK